MFSNSAIVIEGRQQFQVAAGGKSPALDAGTYDVWAAADAYIAVLPADASAAGVTSSTGYKIPGAAGIVPVRVGRDGLVIASSATLSVHRTE